MPRVIIDGRTYHPDELRAGALAELTDPVPASPAAVLAELGITEAGGSWYVLPSGVKVQGRQNAIDAATAEAAPGG